MTREETIHELGEWLEQMIQHGVPSHSAKRKALATAIALLSDDAVPKLRQTDTLIIADALKYLALDTERHLSDRTRADALREQFLKYGARMKGGEEE